MGVRTLLPVACGLFWLMAGEVQGQVSFAVEGRVGVTVPQGDVSDAGAGTGIGIGAELQANFHPNLTAWAGFYRHAFGCEDGCALGNNPRSEGLTGGLKYIFHSPGDVLVWGRGGVVANTFVTDAGSHDRGFGFEVGAGADMPIGNRLFLVPHLGFIRHDAGNDFGAGNGFSVSFFTFGVGLHYHIN